MYQLSYMSLEKICLGITTKTIDVFRMRYCFDFNARQPELLQEKNWSSGKT